MSKQKWKFRNFTVEQVQAIRLSPKSCQALANQLGVTKCTIWKIKKRLTYTDVE